MQKFALLLLAESPVAPFSSCSPLVSHYSNFLNWTGAEYYWLNGLKLHDKYGPAYVVVSPQDMTVVIADPGAAVEVLAPWRDFRKHDDGGGITDLFGKKF